MNMILNREITKREVSFHDSPDDCWIIIRNEVFDITPFLNIHPGGMEILLEFVGDDATSAFESCGHSMHARCMMDKFKIGRLPEAEQSIHEDQYIAYAKMGIVA